MLSLVTPHLHVDHVLQLQPAHLQALGLRGLLLDVDGTLKEFRATGFSKEIRTWIGGLKVAGIRLCMLSNGLGPRIEKLAAQLDVPFIAKALKPLPFGCRRALEKIGVSSWEAAIVGDQLFADVLAGRLAGMRTILVTPASLAEPWFTGIKRPFERQVLRWIQPCRALPVVMEVTVGSASGAELATDLNQAATYR